MSRLKQVEADAIAAIEEAVINDTPQAVAKLFRKWSGDIFTAHILGIAGRFRGLEMVKVLVENGASFRQNIDAVRHIFPRINEFATYLPDFFILFLLRNVDRTRDYILKGYLDQLSDKEGHPLKPVCEEELMRVVEYLCDHAGQVCFPAGDFLYFAILTDDTKTVAALKDKGITISDAKKQMLTKGSKGNDWFAYCEMVGRLKNEDFIRVMSALLAEVGEEEKLHFTDGFYYRNEEKFFVPEYFRFFLEHYNQTRMNKTRLLRQMIWYEKVPCLAIAADCGWIRLPRKRDEMIQYATENKRMECIAFLLEYKNRTADFAAEAERADRKLMRELNANPNSVTQLKKTWGFQKKEDGTLVITGYKGDSTEIAVPETIGRYRVTEIGELAFSPYAPRLKPETRQYRENIAKITLPESIQVIGSNAFRGLMSLREIGIPTSVKSIGACAFGDCNQLKAAVIPEGVTVIGEGLFGCWHSIHGGAALESVVLPGTLDIFQDAESAKDAPEYFQNCTKLTVRIPPLPAARIYCEKYGVKYEYV